MSGPGAAGPAHPALVLEGRAAVVTGGSGAIGTATAVALAEHGAAVAIIGRKQEPL